MIERDGQGDDDNQPDHLDDAEAAARPSIRRRRWPHGPLFTRRRAIPWALARGDVLVPFHFHDGFS